MALSFLVHHAGDVVGVAIEDIEAGRTVHGSVQDGTGEHDLEARDAVPLGHKIALTDIAEGAEVVKYGVVIGRATRPITAGEHVHTHNLKGQRWA